MTLVSIHSQQEWERVRAFAGDIAECGSNCGSAGQNRDCHWFWLGGEYDTTNNLWSWSDGTDWNFEPSFFEQNRAQFWSGDRRLAAWGQITSTCYNKGDGWHDALGSWPMQALCQRYHDPDEALCFAGQYASTNYCLENCANDPTITYLNNTASSCENTLSDSTCEFVCDEGYYATDVASCYNGTYFEGPSCEELPCGEIEGVDFMSDQTSCNGTASGNTCNLICMDGYTARPSTEATCQLGKWTQLPICEENSCAGTPFVNNLNATATNCGNVSVAGSHCYPVCNTLFTAVGNWTCSRGQWTPNDPDYCEVGCDSYPMRTSHMNVAATFQNCPIGTPFSQTCDLVCLPGYVT